MTQRAYTVFELIALRKAVRGLMVLNIGRPYRDVDLALEVEAMVLTHMFAGHTAEDLQSEIDRRHKDLAAEQLRQQRACELNRRTKA